MGVWRNKSNLSRLVRVGYMKARLLAACHDNWLYILVVGDVGHFVCWYLPGVCIQPGPSFCPAIFVAAIAILSGTLVPSLRWLHKQWDWPIDSYGLAAVLKTSWRHFVEFMEFHHNKCLRLRTEDEENFIIFLNFLTWILSSAAFSILLLFSPSNPYKFH